MIHSFYQIYSHTVLVLWMRSLCLGYLTSDPLLPKLLLCSDNFNLKRNGQRKPDFAQADSSCDSNRRKVLKMTWFLGMSNGTQRHLRSESVKENSLEIRIEIYCI